MSKFQYSEQEKNLNKVLKMNQDVSTGMLRDEEMASVRTSADANIASSLELLHTLGKSSEIIKLADEIEASDHKLEHRPEIEDWDEIVRQANECCPESVVLEDVMSENEIEASFRELDAINKEFSRQTKSIMMHYVFPATRKS